VYTLIATIRIKEAAMRNENEMSTKKYWDDRTAEIDADVAASIEAAKNPTRDDLLRRLQAMEAANAENGEVFAAEKIKALKARIVQMDADQAAAFRAEWTKEETMSRRAAWNARVKAGEFGDLGRGKVNWGALRDAEKAQGWTMENLRKAVHYHNL